MDDAIADDTCTFINNDILHVITPQGRPVTEKESIRSISIV